MSLTQTLAGYLAETRAYLHDALGTYTSDADLTTFINKAMQQRDRDTGQNRSLFQFTLSAGTMNYDITTIASTATLLVGSSRNAIDAFGIVLFFGNVRYQMAERTYTQTGSFYQPYQGYQDIPCVYAKYGATQVILGPVPNQNFTTQWDMVVVSNPLVNPTDQDPLPYPWTDPVPFKAAEFAKQQLQQYDEAQQYRQQYMARLAEVTGGARGRFLADPYHVTRTQWP